eukprot:6077997-Amphidinium_carterae.1
MQFAVVARLPANMQTESPQGQRQGEPWAKIGVIPSTTPQYSGMFHCASKGPHRGDDAEGVAGCPIPFTSSTHTVHSIHEGLGVVQHNASDGRRPIAEFMR